MSSSTKHSPATVKSVVRSMLLSVFAFIKRPLRTETSSSTTTECLMTCEKQNTDCCTHLLVTGPEVNGCNFTTMMPPTVYRVSDKGPWGFDNEREFAEWQAKLRSRYGIAEGEVQS